MHPPRKITMYDVAREAGVSPTTVSFLLSGTQQEANRISDETRQRVLAAVEALGYVPNQAARSLRRQRTDRVALLLERLGAPFFETLAVDLQTAAEARGYTLIVMLMGTSTEQRTRAYDQLLRGVVDGAFIAAAGNWTCDDLSRLVGSGLALTVYSNQLCANFLDVVRYPTYDMARQAVRYLRGRGHQRIGFFGWHRPPHETDLRLSGYLDEIREQALEPIVGGVPQEQWLTREPMRAGISAMLRDPDRPTALLCAGDIAAISGLRAAHELGLRVPDDLALVGFGNIAESAFSNPPLTTFGPDPLDFSPAIEFLFSRLAGLAGEQPRVWEMPWKLIERGSA